MQPAHPAASVPGKGFSQATVIAEAGSPANLARDTHSEGCHSVNHTSQGCSEPGALGRSGDMDNQPPRGTFLRARVLRFRVWHEGSFNIGRADLGPGQNLWG